MSRLQIAYGEELIQNIRRYFETIADHRAAHASIPLVDALMSTYAIFSLKFPSLLQFEEERRNRPVFNKNLESIYQITRAPSDTQMREIVDGVIPVHLKIIYREIFSWLQRKKLLRPYEFWKSRQENYYLVSVDGTGYLTSSDVHCSNYLTRTHGDGKVTYHHQMLSAAMMHPELKTVIPFAPVAIIKQDGAEKNDCEMNALKRLVQEFRRDHSHLKVIFNLDALYGNNVIVRLLQDSGISCIISVKPGDHASLFEYVNEAEKRGNVSIYEWEETFGDKVQKNKKCRARYMSAVPLNGQKDAEWVKFVEYWEEIKWTDSQGQMQCEKKHFSWITDLELRGQKQIKRLIEGGRARWKIENETFNTLKNQGYHYEHNYGHGEQYLAENFSILMVLAFLIDQIQQMGCRLFQKVLTEIKRKIRIWEEIRNTYKIFKLTNWTQLLLTILTLLSGEGIELNTS